MRADDSHGFWCFMGAADVSAEEWWLEVMCKSCGYWRLLLTFWCRLCLRLGR